MKELSIEQKAKAFDGNYKAYTELINRLEDVKDAIKKQNYGIAMDILCKPYPEFQITASTELKESEDENIRKELIEYGKPQNKHVKYVDWLEKKGEQKPVDKVEPKFKAGDWVVSEITGSVYQIKNCIENLSNHKYGYDLINGGYICSNEVNRYHLWTIQDAKDGDVLCSKIGNDEMPFIFTGKQDDIAYCALNSFGEFVLSMAEWLLYTSVLPATKKQHDLLFQKMKEAGYDWDTEKKELKKVEQNPADEVGNYDHKEVLQTIINEQKSAELSEEIPTDLKDIVDKEANAIWKEESSDGCHLVIDSFNMFYGICMQIAEAVVDYKKPAWNKEDEKEVAVLEAYIRSKDWSERHIDRALGIVDELVNKVKSLRPQDTWKPSDEQMDMLRIAVSTSNSIVLDSLYNDLEKLKE